MDPLYYSMLHVAAGFLLVAYTFSAFAAPRPERRGFHLMITGVTSLVMLVAGIGLLHKQNLGFPSWVIVKLVCWLFLSALAGIAFRRPGIASVLSLLAAALVIVAIYCVYAKPMLW